MLSRCLRSNLALLVACSGLIFVQSSTGTISGRVLDVSGSVVNGAEVRVTNQVDKNARSLITTSGEFVFTNLEPGIYTLSVKAAGFKQYERKDLHLVSSDRLALNDLQLEVG